MPRIALTVLLAAALLAGSPEAIAFQAGPAEPHHAEASRLIEQTAAAYRAASLLRDEIRLEVQDPGGQPQPQRMTILLDDHGGEQITLQGYTISRLDASVYVTNDSVGDLYLRVPLDGDVAQTVAKLTGKDPGLPAHFAMRAGRDLDTCIRALALGMLRAPRLVGVALRQGADGGPLHVVELRGDNGAGSITIDGRTKLVTAMDIEFSPPGAPSGFRKSARARFAPTVPEAGSLKVEFSPVGRTVVASLADLSPPPPGEGQPAPDFELTALDGTTVTLSDLRGSVVVLDFWATWCRPCILGLPHLQEFDTWARGSGLPIRVFAVDTLERAPDADALRQNAQRVWTNGSFTIDMLLDGDHAVARRYGIAAIPRTYVIDTDGVIATIYSGYDVNMASKLRARVTSLLEKE
jgi:peroxiredoxin